jgi:uncharacterized protein YjbJ (UPF0337 family)
MPWRRRDSDARSARQAMRFVSVVVGATVVIALVSWFESMQPDSDRGPAAPTITVAVQSGRPRGQEGEVHSTMRSSTKDQVAGRYDEAEGKVKEAAGVITGNAKLEARGRAEQAAGRRQQGIGKAKKLLGR